MITVIRDIVQEYINSKLKSHIDKVPKKTIFCCLYSQCKLQTSVEIAAVYTLRCNDACWDTLNPPLVHQDEINYIIIALLYNKQVTTTSNLEIYKI